MNGSHLKKSCSSPKVLLEQSMLRLVERPMWDWTKKYMKKQPIKVVTYSSLTTSCHRGGFYHIINDICNLPSTLTLSFQDEFFQANDSKHRFHVVYGYVFNHEKAA
jgi:hypothetical protein